MERNRPASKASSAESTNELYLLAARRFADLFDGMPVACFTFDLEGTVYEWNALAEELWERPAAEAFQTQVVAAARMDDAESAVRELLSQVLGGEKVRNVEWSIDIEPGRRKWLTVNAFPLRDSAGCVSGGVLAALDITARKELHNQLEAHILQNNENQVVLEMQRDELARVNAKLEALATTDGLTGLKNHRYFQEILEQQFRIGKRSKSPLSLILLDVDHFKQLNDRFGHPAGDLVLRSVGEVILGNLRSSDVAARYGGEEFALILPATDAHGALDAAERFRLALERKELPTGPVTASFGCATLCPADSNRQALIARADAALYAAKRAGRNRSMHFDEIPLAA